MPLFGGRGDDERRAAKNTEVQPRNVQLKDELSELVASGSPKEIDRAFSEAEEAVSEATRADIRGIKMIEQGRCPSCSGRTETLLYTSICTTCGWYRRRMPDSGHCVVHLDTGESLKCDTVFPAEGEQFLCVTDGIVRAQVMRRYVRRIDYEWAEDELVALRDRAHKEREGVCSWCEKDLDDAEEGGPFDEYVAFGACQEHFIFCSKKCMEQFRRQYPSRVHRNCYETECAPCDECVKRFDVHGFKRVTSF